MTNYKNIRVILGFPGIGKTYAFEHQDELGVRVVDSDSSKFSWLPGRVGVERNPDFPANYIRHIEEMLDDPTIRFIFVSSHEAVREALVAKGILCVLVHPVEGYLSKELMLDILRKRSGDKFADMVDSNWDIWQSEVAEFAKDNYTIGVDLTWARMFDVCKMMLDEPDTYLFSENEWKDLFEGLDYEI